MKNRKNKRQLNNKGFSLVELLIAVAILAIIVIPTMKLFVTSAKFNFKSRKSLRTTTIAQDIMEGLRAYNIDEIKDQFLHPDATAPSELATPDPDSEESVSTGFMLIDKDMVGKVGMASKGDACEKYSNFGDLDNRYTNPVSGEEIGLYYFYLQDIDMQGTGDKYDALIRIDGMRYMETGSDIHANDERQLLYNNNDYETIVGVDKTKDATYEQDPLLNYYVLEDLIKDMIDEGIISETDEKPIYFSDLKNNPTYGIKRVCREILVKLENNPAAAEGQHNEVLASIGYRYIFVKDDATDTRIIKWAVGSIGALDPCGVLSKDGTFFLFYYPSYELQNDFEIDSDTIIFDNQTSYNPLEVYCVQQIDRTSSLAPKKGDGTVDEDKIIQNINKHEKNYIHEQSIPYIKKTDDPAYNDLFSCLRFYTANIPIAFDAKETLAKKWYFEPECQVNIAMYTNLNTSIIPQYTESEGGKLPTDNTDEMFGVPGAAFTGYKEVYTLMRHLPAGAPGVEPEHDITEVIYDVEVTLYKEDAMKNGFKDEDIVTTVTGSMVN